MSKRINGFRQKIPLEFLPLIEAANSLKLYLVQEIGPTSFVFKDDFDDKFKVSIGPTISCSCSKTMNNCIHTFYVMLKIFRRNKEDPLIWQNSYIDNEISDLIKSRFETATTSNQKKKFLLKHKNDKNNKENRQTLKKTSRLLIDIESLCPICQEPLDPNEQALTFCKKKCGNNFHIKCLKVWVLHKMSTKELITCPMCRCEMGNAVLENINREEDEFINRFVIHKGKNCENCNMKPIKGNLFHCLYCKNYDLCENCYNNFEHFIHNKFIMKARSDSEWVPAYPREKNYIRDKNDKLFSFCKNLCKYENFKPTDLVYEVFENSNNETGNKTVNSNENLNSYIIKSIPNLENSLNDYRNPTPSSLQIIGVELMTIRTSCVICDQSSTKIKKLFCGHLIDEECLKKLLESSKFSCPIDHVNILEGLDILNKNKIGKKEENQTISSVTKTNTNVKNITLLKRSNTLDKRNSNRKALPTLNILEKEENKENVISNLTSEKIIADIRKEALEKKVFSQNKFRIASNNKNFIMSKKKPMILEKKEKIENFQLIGNNCLLKQEKKNDMVL